MKNNNINNVHDKAYKEIFPNKEDFHEFLRDFVDNTIAEKIDRDSLILVDKSFILPDYAEIESDLIYKGKIGGSDVIIYILLEFQSSVDYRMATRLFFYMSSIWRDIVTDTPKKIYEIKDFKLPPILPIVVYNGEDKWTADRTFAEEVAKSELLKDYQINFKYPLIEINSFDKKSLYETETLISAFFALDQNIDWTEFLTRLIEISELYNNLSDEKKNILKHWLKVTVDTKDHKEVKDAIDILFDKEAVLKMTSNLSNILDREFEAREKKGEQKARKIVITQLNKKFPNLPQSINDELQKAKIEVIEKIAEDIFIIDTIEELENYL
jgi:predicted transposase/invertase (TIGR01784 family)